MHIKTKWICLLLVGMMALSLAACGSKKESDSKDTQTTESAAKTESETESETDDTKKDTNGGERTVTIPMSFFQIYDQDELKGMLEEKGASAVALDDVNRTVTFSGSEEMFQSMLASQKVNIDEAIASMTGEGSTYPSYVTIAYNEDVTQFDVTVNDQFNEDATFGAQALFAQGNDYQMLNGVPEDAINTVVKYISESTGETLETMDTASIGDEYSGNNP